MIMIKGGWLGRIPQWQRWHDNRKAILSDPETNKFKWGFVKAADWLLDGTQLSVVFMGALVAAIQPDAMTAAYFAFAWWLFVMSSMGEEAGAVGDYKEGWGPYVEYEEFGRKYGAKKALMHGIAGGALLSLATGWVWFIPALAAFPLVYFLGSSLHRLVHGQRAWPYSEVLYDAIILLALGVWVYG